MKLPHPGSHSVLVLPDAHYPFQDKAAMDCVMKTAAYLRPRRIVILGDWLDAATFSSHGMGSLKDTAPPDFIKREVMLCNEALDKLQKYCKELIFIEGNHCYRVERWAASHGPKLGPELFELLSPRKLLSKRSDGTDRENFHWVPYSEQLSHFEIAPDLWALHGWSTSANAAKAHLDKAVSVSVVFGHVHRAQSFARRDPANGRVLKAWSPGCLCALQASYMKQNPSAWVHGFSIVWVGSEAEDWTDYSVTIKNGRAILPDGAEIVGRP